MFPRRSGVIGRDPGLARRACYVSRQVPGEKGGMVRMAFPVSLMCMCHRYSECTCGVGKAVVSVGKLAWAGMRSLENSEFAEGVHVGTR